MSLLTNLEHLFRDLCKTETAEKVKPLIGFEETWKIEWICYKSNQIYLFVSLDKYFPASHPSISIEKDIHEKIGWLPHVNENHSICCYDEETIVTDSENPLGIITEYINQAKKIIRAGLESNNTKEFFKELKSYWMIKYPGEKYEPIGTNSFIYCGELPKNKCEVQVYSYVGAENLKHFIIDDDFNKNFIENLNLVSYKFKKAYFLGELGFIQSPPYCLHTSDIINNIEHLIDSELLDYYLFSNHNIIFFGKKDNTILGFEIVIDNTFKGGNGQLRRKIRRKENNIASIRRIYIDQYSENRLELRSRGDSFIRRANRNISVVGLGSVGSLLLEILINYSFDKIFLCDNDCLNVENLGRHALGIKYCGLKKTEAMSIVLKQKMPLTQITSYNESIVKLLYDTHSDLYFSDLIFVAIGNEQVEKEIRKLIYKGVLNKDVLFFWVEPYVAGGHLMYLRKQADISIEDKIFEKSLCKFNVIDNDFYIEDSRNEISKLSKNEYGCRGNYTPYSGESLNLYLSAMTEIIHKIIYNEIEKSIHITWVGNINYLKLQNIKVSDLYLDKAQGAIITRSF